MDDEGVYTDDEVFVDAFSMAARLVSAVADEFGVCLPCLVEALNKTMKNAVKDGAVKHADDTGREHVH